MAAVEDRGDTLDSDVEEEEVVEDRGDAVQPAVEAKAEAEVEEAEEAEAEPEPTAGQTIPFSRFRAQNVRLREAEERAKQLETEMEALKQQPAATPEPAAEPARDFDADLEAAEKKLADALADNDATAILTANREIRAVERAQFQAEITAVRQEATQTQTMVAEKSFEDALTMVESEFPMLDPTADAFDSLRQTLVQDLLRTYEAQGMSSEDGLLKAVAMAFPETLFAQELLGIEAEPAAAPAKGKSTRGLAAKLEAVKSTPPDLGSAGGENSDAAGMVGNVDVSKLSDEEFAALPAEMRARLRGDVVGL